MGLKEHNQLHTLNGLRGVAAVSILLHHITVYFLPEIGKAVQSVTPFLHKNYIWVDFFFIVSGFTLAHVYQDRFAESTPFGNYRSFIRSRFLRIYPLHLVILLMFVGLDAVHLLYETVTQTDYPLIDHIISKRHTIPSLVTNLTLLQTLHWDAYWNEPAWAISAMWICYFTIPLMLRFFHKRSWLVDGSIAGVAIAGIITLTLYIGNLDFVSWKSLFRCEAGMVLGILAYKYRSKAIFKQYLDRPSSFWILLALIGTTLFINVNHAITVFLFIGLIICGGYSGDKKAIGSNAVLLHLGKMSYSLYMSHWLVLSILDRTAILVSGEKLHASFSLESLIPMAVATILLCYLISLTCHYYIEVPLNRQTISYLRSRTVS